MYFAIFISLYLNDIKDKFFLHGLEGVDTSSLKLFFLLYADDDDIFRNSSWVTERIRYFKILL